MTETTTPPETERGQLEAERDFLLRSLDDLEGERADGAIDAESYQRLHDDYTARAAAVIRALRDGLDARPPTPPTSTRRRALILGGVVAFAALAGVALAAALGARLPGQTSSGNSTGGSSATASVDQVRRALEATVAHNPTDVQARLQLALILERGNDLRGALAQYDEITKLDPSSAEAEAQAGRILYLTARASPPNAAQLVALSKARLDHAVVLAPQYPDAHYYRAIVLANEYQDYAGAANECQRYLVLAPNGPWAGSARQLLAQAANALAGPTTTSPAPSRKATP